MSAESTRPSVEPQLAAAECERLARPVGSAFRLASLKLPPARQRAVTALRALDVSLAEIPETVSEPQVAMAKLDWWREALLGMTQGRAEHPVIQSLAAGLEAIGLGEEARREDSPLIAQLEERLGAARIELEYEGFAAETDLEAFLDARYASLFALYGRLLDLPAGQIDAAAQLGRWHGRLDRARLLGRHARLGRVYLPQDTLNRFGLDEADLYREPAPTAREDLFRDELEAIRSGLDAWPVTGRPPRLFRILRAIDREHLRLMQETPAQLTGGRVEISPVRQWWLAWRASW
ncbi:squalene/phytoene synthase family protein [Guyparkeria halophila]|uniref:Squalene/phytoene synthase family protein n=1 Tax=Guyparkeria halophila TaxID=47960 RepID=A0ABZ0YY96_9GAMM|nr:squalene/phytoene synthase family protein [Guyparkeria halophila]WQH17161.1 squalene/phytoene synthase family protein [Guyparkeria halophila]